jgi:predicted nucleic-acid-binding Zn-ribbon protein
MTEKTCVLCNGTEFFKSTLYARSRKDFGLAPNIYKFEKVFIEQSEEENYPVFQEITSYHCKNCGYIMLFHR